MGEISANIQILLKKSQSVGRDRSIETISLGIKALFGLSKPKNKSKKLNSIKERASYLKQAVSAQDSIFLDFDTIVSKPLELDKDNFLAMFKDSFHERPTPSVPIN